MSNIVLTGYRCTGKTSVGRRLAVLLSRPFYDTDEWIRERTGASVRRIVVERGWVHFRAVEKTAVTELAAVRGAVIALGGGAVLDPDNRAAVKMQGTVIWLTADVPTIVARMERDGASVSDRPPLLGEDRLDETARVLSERAPLYRAAADFTVDTMGKTVDDIVAEIAGLLSGFHPGA
mgnify:CR=1 FL=1|jgi:shikimate kinase